MPRLALCSPLGNLRVGPCAQGLHTTAVNCKKPSKPRRVAESQSHGPGWLGRSRDELSPSGSDIRSERKPQAPKRWLDQPLESPERVKPAAPAPSLTSSAPDAYAQYRQIYTDPSLRRVSKTTRQTTTEPWMPTKKLSLSAMAGLKALHEADPEKFSRSELSERFGISHEAVRRITKSKFRENDDEALDARLTKWDTSPVSGEALSPVPALKRAFERAGIEMKPKTSRGVGFKPSKTAAPRSQGGFGVRKKQEARSETAAPRS